MTITEFIRSHGLVMSASPATANPHMTDMPAGSRHWRCEIRKGSQKMIIPFSQGPAYKTPPTLADVLDCLASDASTLENAHSFEEWDSELGCDTDSRQAERTYHATAQQTEALRNLIGADGLHALMYDVKRL